MEIIPGRKFNNLNIGDTPDDIMEKMGFPEELYPTADNYDEDIDHSYYWRYPSKGIDIEFDRGGGGRVTCIHLFAQKIPNTKYIPIKLPWSSRAEIRAAFGPPDKIDKMKIANIKTLFEGRHGINAMYDNGKELSTLCIWDVRF